MCYHGGTCISAGVCRCSLYWTGPRCTSYSFCFYGKDKVNLIDGGQRSIEELKVGDRIWSISDDGKSLIKDEIVLMMQNGPNATALFYTFKTKEGYEVSLTATHNIPVFLPEENRITFLRASKVTTKHRLIMFNRKVEIENISMNSRIGYFAPLTLSGYLFVNNISTSVFSDSYRVSPNTLQRVFTPIRVYYHVMRWIFGKNYDPFETDLKVGLHPLPSFLKQHELEIRIICYSLMYIVPTLFIAFIVRAIQKFLFKSSH